jgi:hypothetical protein
MTPERYARLLDKLAAAETDLTRAVNKWQKARAQVKRAARALDKQFVERAGGPGGAVDWRELALSAAHVEETPERAPLDDSLDDSLD